MAYPSKQQSGSVLMTSPSGFPLHQDLLGGGRVQGSALTSALELLRIHVNRFLPPLAEFINPYSPTPIPSTPTALF